jgi:hypothetical protein
MKHLLRTAALVAGRGEIGPLVKEVKDRIYSNQVSLMLRRDLHDQQIGSEPKVPISLRHLETADLRLIIRERPRRLPVLLADIPTCYMAVTQRNDLAFMVWVICREDWPHFQPHFKGDLQRDLHPDECLFEFAYTFEKFRRQGVMAASSNLIAKQIVKERPSLRWAYNYVRKDNIPSLKGCQSAGFLPYMSREERWRAFYLTQQFSFLHAEMEFLPEQTKAAHQLR